MKNWTLFSLKKKSYSSEEANSQRNKTGLLLADAGFLFRCLLAVTLSSPRFLLIPESYYCTSNITCLNTYSLGTIVHS